MPAPKYKQHPVVVAARGCPEWREYVEKMARTRRVTIAGLVEQLVTETAKRDGLPAPPARNPSVVVAERG